MISVGVLALLALASYRITRLIVIDSILDELRDWFFKKLDYRHDKKTDVYYSRNFFMQKLSYLIQCTWCAGVWVSAGVYWLWDHEIYVPIVIAAIAGAQGMIHALEPSDE